jgi:hypothetical protein
VAPRRVSPAYRVRASMCVGVAGRTCLTVRAPCLLAGACAVRIGGASLCASLCERLCERLCASLCGRLCAAGTFYQSASSRVRRAIKAQRSGG